MQRLGGCAQQAIAARRCGYGAFGSRACAARAPCGPWRSVVASGWRSLRSLIGVLVLVGVLAEVGFAAPRKLPPGLVRRDPGGPMTQAAGILAGACLIAAAAGRRGRSRSPLREGPAVRRPDAAASAQTEPPRALRLAVTVPASEGVVRSVGVDTLGVRRANAPQLRPRGKGQFARARAALASAEAGQRAVQALEADVYAKSSVAPFAHRLLVLRRLASTAVPPFQLLPLTPSTVIKFGAALKAGGYRSAPQYLRTVKKAHIKARHPWTDELNLWLVDVCRSCLRGIGPGKQAFAFGLERLARLPLQREPCSDGGPICPVETGICMALWMLRGMEAAAVLGEQAVIDEERTVAILDLGPTKTDPEGRGCRRSLLCACKGTCGTGGPEGAICPVQALSSVLSERRRLGLSPKHPLFPQADGRATSARQVCADFSQLLATGVSEHSFRREGAQYYARNSVQEGLIQFLGRWGGATVKRYIGEALDGQASTAARDAAHPAGYTHPTRPRGLTDAALHTPLALMDQLGQGTLAGNADNIVKRAVEATRQIIDERDGAAEARWARAAADRLGGVRRVGVGLERPRVHRIAMGDGCVPTRLWATSCGWRFGQVSHVRVCVGAITCKRCLGHPEGGESIDQVGDDSGEHCLAD